MTDLSQYLLETDYEGTTAGADEPDFDSDRLKDITLNVINIGLRRIQQLDALKFEPHRDGCYYLPYCHIGYGHDFVDEANHKIMSEKYPWLGLRSDGEIFGMSELGHREAFEKYLAKIPDEQWSGFLEDLQHLKQNIELDSDAAQELEQLEAARWMKEEGPAALIRRLLPLMADSFTAFAIDHVTPSMMWDLCGELEEYPEAQGDGSVWLNTDKLAKNPETLPFLMRQFEPKMPRLKKAWSLVKRRCFERHSLFESIDLLIRKNLLVDDEAQSAYARLDREGIYRLFLELTPDSAYQDPVRPSWQPVLLTYSRQGEQWLCTLNGPEHSLHLNWREDLVQGLDRLMQHKEVVAALKQIANNEPKDYPELNLGEALDPGDELDLERYTKGTGGLRINPVYSDELIEIVEPRDPETLDALLRKPEGTTKSHWHGTWAYATILAVLDRKTHEPLGAYEDEDGCFRAIVRSEPLSTWLKSKHYGKAVRRGFLKVARDWWTQGVQEGDDKELAKTIPHLLSFGGYKEVQRRLKASGNEHLLGDYGMFLAMAAVRAGDYQRAADYFGLKPEEFNEKGAWVYYSDYDELACLFDNKEWAENALTGETLAWFDYPWEKGNMPSLEDLAEWLDKDAKEYIRELMINRVAYFPDAGDDKKGEYITLTRAVLAEFSDDELLQWVVDPTEEDLADGVFDDIREAIQRGGAKLLESAGRDQLEAACRSSVRSMLDVIEAKYVDHPTKKGQDRLAFFISWNTIIEAYDKRVEDAGSDYTDSLSEMLKDAHHGDISAKRTDTGAEWPAKTDSSAEYYREIASEEVLELAPTHQEEDPRQIQMPFKESLDDPPEDLAGWLDKLPGNVSQHLMPVIEQVGQSLGINPQNIQMRFDRAVIDREGSPYSLFFIEFDCAPGAAFGTRYYPFGETVNKHVINEMAQVGYVVTEGNWRLNVRSHPGHPVFAWTIDRSAKWQ